MVILRFSVSFFCVFFCVFLTSGILHSVFVSCLIQQLEKTDEGPMGSKRF